MKRFFTACAALVVAHLSYAQSAPSPQSGVGWPDAPVTSITPVFAQLVGFTLPQGFVPAHEDARNGQYIRESVLRGETLEKWTQMVTLTGAQGLATNPQATPRRMVEFMAAGFKRACPTTFAALDLGDTKVAGHDAMLAVVGCGKSASPVGSVSETMLVLSIRGERDLYSLQWSVRGEPLAAAPILDRAQWMARLQALTPVRVCARVAGEAAPYPSCIESRP